ncbi:MAG: alpha/beta fold hydrolase [Phycisphaerales bacterium]|nr:MAG: alpha/beta fold hydrolase [Phycisphaerales bacterium]
MKRVKTWTACVGALAFLVLGACPAAGGDEPTAAGTDRTGPVTSGYVDIEGGKLFYESAGAGPVIVLIHDGLMHREVWENQFPALADQYRLIRYDRQGYGKSETPKQPYSDADDLLTLFRTLNVERATLMGGSSGGGLAVEFTLEHPEMVDALVLVGAVVEGLGTSAHFMKRAYANFKGTPEETMELWINDRYQIAPQNESARKRMGELLRANPQNLDLSKHRLRQRPPYYSLERLSEIRVPTLIVVGEADTPDVHAHAGAIESGILGAYREVVAGAGHLVYLEQPQEFNRLVGEFLSLIARRLERGGPNGKSAPETSDALPFESGFVKVDGTALYYEVLGQGEPLVMIHGGLLDHRMWDDQFDVFAKRYKVIRYDARGHGLTNGPSGSFHDHEDLLRLLQHLGVERAHVMGLSMGGRIAVDLALEHPEMVKSLIPVSSGLSGYNFTGPDFLENTKNLREAYRKGDYALATEWFQRAWTDGPERTPEQVDPKVRERVHWMIFHCIQPGRNLAQALSPEPPAISRLGEIKVPMLIILGDLDMSDIHVIVDKLAKDVEQAQKVVMPNAAHMVNMEQPVAFNKAVLEFLAQQ